MGSHTGSEMELFIWHEALTCDDEQATQEESLACLLYCYPNHASAVSNDSGLEKAVDSERQKLQTLSFIRAVWSFTHTSKSQKEGTSEWTFITLSERRYWVGEVEAQVFFALSACRQVCEAVAKDTYAMFSLFHGAFTSRLEMRSSDLDSSGLEILLEAQRLRKKIRKSQLKCDAESHGRTDGLADGLEMHDEGHRRLLNDLQRIESSSPARGIWNVCERFFSVYLQTVQADGGTFLDALKGIPSVQLDQPTLLNLQSLINRFFLQFGDDIVRTAVFFQGHLLWSNINASDLWVLYRFLQIREEDGMMRQARTSHCEQQSCSGVVDKCIWLPRCCQSPQEIVPVWASRLSYAECHLFKQLSAASATGTSKASRTIQSADVPISPSRLMSMIDLLQAEDTLRCKQRSTQDSRQKNMGFLLRNGLYRNVRDQQYDQYKACDSGNIWSAPVHLSTSIDTSIHVNHKAFVWHRADMTFIFLLKDINDTLSSLDRIEGLSASQVLIDIVFQMKDMLMELGIHQLTEHIRTRLNVYQSNGRSWKGSKSQNTSLQLSDNAEDNKRISTMPIISHCQSNGILNFNNMPRLVQSKLDDRYPALTATYSHSIPSILLAHLRDIPALIERKQDAEMWVQTLCDGWVWARYSAITDTLLIILFDSRTNIKPHSIDSRSFFIPITFLQMSAKEICASSSRYVQELAAISELFRSLSKFVTAHGNAIASTPFYTLTAEEICDLERANNTAQDWRCVVKLSDACVDASRIRNCAFHGYNAIGSFNGFCSLSRNGPPLASGCYDTVISNCIIMDDALVKDTVILHRTIVHEEAVIIRCGCIDISDKNETSLKCLAFFGNGEKVVIGSELGGRSVRIVADISFELAAAAVQRHDEADQEFREDWKRQVDEYLNCLCSNEQLNSIGKKATILYCNRIQNCYIGEKAHIEDSVLRNTTVLSSTHEPSRVDGKLLIEDSIIQHNATLDSMCVVQQSLICRNAKVERQALIRHSIIGPGTSVAEGEVTSSLVGPLVGFHHQSLLIATIWPQGRGNVAYGANVGSNHTLRLPDQELFPGEGMFFGLGVNVKFPSNFVHAPYSVLASGVSSLAQCMEFPFTLINTPRCVIPDLSPAINEIFPGWVLESSIFTILRNEIKFKTRLQSSESSHQILYNRPDLVACMKVARACLAKAKGPLLYTSAKEAVYTKTQVYGLGSNYMTESSRVSGIESYTLFIRLSALEALLEVFVCRRIHFLRQMTVKEVLSALNALEKGPMDKELLETLRDDYEDKTHVSICIQELIKIREELVKRATQEIMRDEERGCRITPAYTAVHSPAHKQSIIQAAQSHVEAIQTQVASLLKHVNS